jgi:hypothetical protein
MQALTLRLLAGIAAIGYVCGGLNEISITYDASLLGHRSLGVAIGQRFSDLFALTFDTDPELARLVDFTRTADGESILSSLVNSSKNAFPLFYEEIIGMAYGSGQTLERLLVNNFREELVQFAPDAELGRVSKCSTVFVSGGDTLALGHNDDWTQNWRNLSYWIFGTEQQPNGATLSFGTWVYPGYLPGMDLSFNSHGLVYSVNSLFPKLFERGGIGTAFVARNLLAAGSIGDAVRRASMAGVSTAMSYNLGSTVERRLLQLEVNSRGGADGYATRPVAHESYFHGNEFVVLDVPQYADNSTRHRAARWQQLQPVRDIRAMRAFLGDEKGEWPVFRNKIAPDDCFTEVSAVFDLNKKTLSVWALRVGLQVGNDRQLAVSLP